MITKDEVSEILTYLIESGVFPDTDKYALISIRKRLLPDPIPAKKVVTVEITEPVKSGKPLPKL